MRPETSGFFHPKTGEREDLTGFMKFIIGKKLEMSQRFTADGKVVPVTLISAGPCTVTQVRTQAKDGYEAVQLGYAPKRRIGKAGRGHLTGLPTFGILREFRTDGASKYSRGQGVDAGVFVAGDSVEVEGMSKGRGFQGVVKRHGFAGHPASHGHKDQLRMPGSIGSKRQGPVAPGKRMAGRMGGDQVTVKNLEVVEVDAEKGTIAVKGAVPGARGSLVLLSGPGEMELAAPVAAAEAAIEPTVETPAPEAAKEEAAVAEAPAEAKAAEAATAEKAETPEA